MSEIQPHQVPANKQRRKQTAPRRPDNSEKGLYESADTTDYLLRYAVPVLADTLGATRHDFRGLIGKEGALSRDARKRLGAYDRVNYNVFAERSVDTDDRNKKYGVIVLQITACYYHTLDEAELITEWPILEELGAADDLVVDAMSFHTRHHNGDEDADLDDPVLNAEMMRGQLDTLSELDEEDEDTMVAVMYGQEVERFYEKQLRIVSSMKPILTIRAGYETDVATYALNIGDAYTTDIHGDTPSELAVLSQLRQESFATIDAEVLHDFEEALALTGIIKR